MYDSPPLPCMGMHPVKRNWRDTCPYKVGWLMKVGSFNMVHRGWCKETFSRGIPSTDGLFVPRLREGGIQPGNPTYSRTVGLATSKLRTIVNPNPGWFTPRHVKRPWVYHLDPDPISTVDPPYPGHSRFKSRTLTIQISAHYTEISFLTWTSHKL